MGTNSYFSRFVPTFDLNLGAIASGEQSAHPQSPFASTLSSLESLPVQFHSFLSSPDNVDGPMALAGSPGAKSNASSGFHDDQDLHSEIFGQAV